jgi:hypothetical protein
MALIAGARRFSGLAGFAVPPPLRQRCTDYFQIPTDRVVEVGTQVTI